MDRHFVGKEAEVEFISALQPTDHPSSSRSQVELEVGRHGNEVHSSEAHSVVLETRRLHDLSLTLPPHPNKQIIQRQDGFSMSKPQVRARHLLLQIEVRRVLRLQRLLLLSLGQVAQQTAQQSRQHRAAQRTRHLEVELAALALVHDQPHVVVHAELLEDVGLALQHGAGVIVGVVAGGLGMSREKKEHFKLTHGEHVEEELALLRVLDAVRAGENLVPDAVVALHGLDVRIVIETALHQIAQVRVVAEGRVVLWMKKCREGDRADGEEANRSVIVEHGLVHVSFGVKDVLTLVGVDEMEVVLREGRGKEILQEDIARLLRSLLERVLNDNVSAHILVQA